MSSSVIDLVSDEDEDTSQDDLQRAIALSLSATDTGGGGGSSQGGASCHNNYTTNRSQDGGGSSRDGGGSRRDVGGSSSSGGSSGAGGGSYGSPGPTSSDGGSAGPPIKRQRISPRPTKQPQAMAPLFRLNSIPEKGTAGSAEAVTFQEVMSGDWTEAYLVNFDFEVEWLIRDVPRLGLRPEYAEVMLVGGENIKKLIDKADGLYRGRWFAAQVHAYGSHHTKMGIMVFPIGVRIFITTANLTRNDWTRKAQAVWWQEFPYKSTQPGTAKPQRLGNGSNSTNDNDFGEVLCEYVRKTVSGPSKSEPHRPAPGSSGARLLDLAAMLEDRVDFSAARVKLVTSLPGNYKGAELKKYGHMRVRDILENEPLPNSFFSPPVISASSTGPGYPSGYNFPPGIPSSVMNNIMAQFGGRGVVVASQGKPVAYDSCALPDIFTYNRDVMGGLTGPLEPKEREIRASGKRKLNESTSADTYTSSVSSSSNGYTHTTNGYTNMNNSVASGTHTSGAKTQATMSQKSSGVLIPGGKKGIPLPDDLRVVCQCSSFGSLNDDWLNALAVSFTTFAGCEERPVIANTQKGKASAAAANGKGKGKAVQGGSGASPQLKRLLQVIWPSADFVRTCIEGWTGGITVPAPPKNVLEPIPNSKEFRLQVKRSLQPIFHKYTSTGVRSDVIPHLKSYFLYRAPASKDDKPQLAWLLVGSHNMSNPAMGKLVTDGTQLAVASYEISLMFLPSQLMRPDTSQGFTVDPLGPLYQPKRLTYGGLSSFFDLEENGLPFHLLPLPYDIPPTPYPPPSANPPLSSVPWCYKKKFEGLDRIYETWSKRLGAKWNME